MPGTRFTWKIDFHHDDHFHPFVATATGTSGSVTIPNEGHTETNVWYRVHLTVTDSAGQAATIFTDVRPRTVTLTLASSPSGAVLTRDGQPVTAPSTFLSVVGMRRVIGAASSMTVGGVTYNFKSWSDHPSQTRTITTPTASQTYTATYRIKKGGGRP